MKVRDQGISVVTALGILAIVAILAVAVMQMVLGNIGVTKHITAKKESFNAAETGIEYVLGRLLISIGPVPAVSPGGDTAWFYLDNGLAFKTGGPDEPPQPLHVRQMFKLLPGFSTKHAFNYYRFTVTGKARGGKAYTIIETETRVGPLPSGSGY